MAETTDLNIETWVTTLNAKKAALQAQLSTLTGQVRDIDIQLRGIRERQAEVANEAARAGAIEERERQTLRATMTAVLAELGDFTHATLFEAIKQKMPDAKPDSVRSELSKAINERHEAIQAGEGFKGGRAMPATAVVTTSSGGTPAVNPGQTVAST